MSDVITTAVTALQGKLADGFAAGSAKFVIPGEGAIVADVTLEIAMPTAKKITSIKLENEIDLPLQKLATLTDRSPHYLMQKAITEFVEREEKIEKFRLETIAAYEEFAMTGHSISNDEAQSWLKNLAKGIISEPPQ